MTVSYTRSLATFEYGALVRLLLRWRGGVYKAVWPSVLTFSLIYAAISLTYYLLPSNTIEQIETKRKFVQFCAYISQTSNAIPVSFVLGFFVNMVVGRWWEQFINLPTPDAVCLLMTTFLRRQPRLDTRDNVDPQIDRPLLFRRTIARYLNLSCALCFYAISLSLRRHISTLDELVTCGLMTKQELDIYLKLSHENHHFFIPLVWAITLLTRAHHEGMIYHERYLDAMVTEVVNYWRKLQTLFLYDYVNVPLVYNQVVTLVVYVYLASSVLSHQFSDPVALLRDIEAGLKRASNTTLLIAELGSNTTTNDIPTLQAKNIELLTKTLNVTPNFPIFAILSLVFYMGWLRVAETNVFPFGDDDDDFEVIPLLERNISAGVWFVDDLIGSETEVINLINQQKTVEIFPRGPKGDGGEGAMPPHVLTAAMKHGAMGSKKTPETHPGGPEAIQGPTLIFSPPGEEPVIPELPCPPDLRRRTSKYFFAGSINRLEEEAEVDTETKHTLTGSTSSLSHHQSVGGIVGRVSRRISQAFGAPSRTADQSGHGSSALNLHTQEAHGTLKVD